MDKQSRLARTILNGFTAYFAEFENITLSARTRFENAEWRAAQEASMRRIDIYKIKVLETIDVVEYIAAERLHDLTFWAETRDIYAQLVRGMTNFEIAETYYNSIFNAVFKHRWIRDDYAFVFHPKATCCLLMFVGFLNTYRTRGDIRQAVEAMLHEYAMSRPYEDFERECARVTEVMTAAVVDAGIDKQADIELHALEHHFFRNKAAYIVGRISGKGLQIPFVIPMLHTESEASPAVYLDACLLGSDIIPSCFHSHEPTSWWMHRYRPNTCSFLQQLMHVKRCQRSIAALAITVTAKPITSERRPVICARPRTRLVPAPGIKGMVMAVFTLPSYEYVFKIIKDRFTPPKEVTHQEVRDKYQLVKRWDRAGRMADTQEFANLVLTHRDSLTSCWRARGYVSVAVRDQWSGTHYQTLLCRTSYAAVEPLFKGRNG